MKINKDYGWGLPPLILTLLLSIWLAYLSFKEVHWWIDSGLDFTNKNGSLVTIVGWLTLTSLGIYAGKIQLRNSAKLEIYKELYSLKSKMDTEALNLNLSLSFHSLPFLQMSWTEKKIPVDGLQNDKTAGQLWLEHVSKIEREKSKFVDSYLRLWNYINMWRAELSSLSEARDILFSELNGLCFKSIPEYTNYLNDLLLKESYDWTKWDRESIKTKSEKISDEFGRVAITYPSDFIDMTHEELIQPIFAKKRIPREDYNYPDFIVSSTLTRSGIKEVKYSPTRIASLRKRAP